MRSKLINANFELRSLNKPYFQNFQTNECLNCSLMKINFFLTPSKLNRDISAIASYGFMIPKKFSAIRAINNKTIAYDR